MTTTRVRAGVAEAAAPWPRKTTTRTIPPLVAAAPGGGSRRRRWTWCLLSASRYDDAIYVAAMDAVVALPPAS
ncbi:hypothetical protein E2562_038726 [Oryza meyeriana var. granulata]|uniref:Uncharacterized protein n=1 Tax=Oryza meyeriana var. granulata TaxID=110450 RepID=A0A6G1DTF6_9ORYZ|nr:hypothetical protein E2562_038726 [Oryza meyeriana var. granulata]